MLRIVYILQKMVYGVMYILQKIVYTECTYLKKLCTLNVKN